MSSLPGPGETVTYDYRIGRVVNSRLPIKCIQWNIERGYKLDLVIDELLRQDGDILCLQELDIECERSGGRNCALEIAKALKMKCVFVTEFVEHKSIKRNKKLQGGGVHGNAILSKYNFDAWSKPHSHQPYDWDKRGIDIGEPRNGFRSMLTAYVYPPSMGEQKVLVYSLHLEVFCGMVDRLRQFNDVLQDAKRRIKETPYQIIFGDLNTLGHGIARFHTRYCRDVMRFRSLGFSESGWWMHHVFNLNEPANHNEKLHKFKLGDMINGHFFDPFDVEADTTLRAISGLYSGKLDWTLLRGWLVKSKGMSNMNYKISDHRLLYVNISIFPTNTGEDPGILAYMQGFRKFNIYRGCVLRLLILIILLLIFLSTR